VSVVTVHICRGTAQSLVNKEKTCESPTSLPPFLWGRCEIFKKIVINKYKWARTIHTILFQSKGENYYWLFLLFLFQKVSIW
jgi:hypothetical protein